MLVISVSARTGIHIGTGFNIGPATNFERPCILRTWLGSARNFGKTRFGRFAIFDFLTPKKFFRKKISVEIVFSDFFSVFRYFRQILEDLRIFGRQNQILRGILLQMVKFSGP